MGYKTDFPILKNHPNLIYFDSASTALKPSKVIDTVNSYYTEYSANVHRGLYPLSLRATDELEASRSKIAKFINADVDEVIFTFGTTDSINLLSLGLIKSGVVPQSPRILITELEHHSNILPWQDLEKVNLDYSMVDRQTLELDYNSMSQSEYDVVSITGLSNVTGEILDIKNFRQLFPNSILIVDAAQLVTHAKIDVKELDVDFLVFSGHKLYGPTGIGVLYGKRSLLEKLKPFRTGGGMIRSVNKNSFEVQDIPSKFEAGTLNIAGAIGLGAAIDYVESVGFDAVGEVDAEVGKYLDEKLRKIPGVRIFRPQHNNKSFCVTSFTVENIHGHDISEFLGNKNICVRAGNHCAQILHKEILGVNSSVRISLGLYNDKEDVDRFINSLEECIEYYS